MFVLLNSYLNDVSHFRHLSVWENHSVQPTWKLDNLGGRHCMNYEQFCISLLNRLLNRTWSQFAGAPQTSCCPKVGCVGWNSMNLRNQQHTASAWRREFQNLSWWLSKDSSSNTCCSPTRRDGKCQRKIILYFYFYSFLESPMFRGEEDDSDHQYYRSQQNNKKRAYLWVQYI